MTTMVELKPGDGTLTRRILKSCRSAGIEVDTQTRYTKWGPKIEAYLVPKTIHDEELARREAEKEAQYAARQRKVEQQKAASRRRRIGELSERFPLLDAEIVDSLADAETVLSPDETGYQHGIGTKSYWDKLGFRAMGSPAGFVVRGKRLFEVYHHSCLKPKRSRLTAAELEERWIRGYGTKELVLAQALRFANRLQKVRHHPDLYQLKDRWITSHQDNLVEGRVARVEKKMCWGCDGSGIAIDEDYDGFDDDFVADCLRCYGTGVWSRSTLYEHRFDIDKKRFVFHSYVRPRVVSDEAGANATVYGRPFDAEELPLPPQSVIVELLKKLLGND